MNNIVVLKKKSNYYNLFTLNYFKFMNRMKIRFSVSNTTAAETNCESFPLISAFYFNHFSRVV